jgi:outer membrane receptor protein involved in Fe transport
VVVDVDDNPQKVLIYNLNGTSFSNSAQIEFSWEIRKRLNFKTAYRFVETKTKFSKEVLQKPLQAMHRAFLNIGYETKNEKWLFDYTTQWYGKKRIPSTLLNPIAYQLTDYSPSFFNVNAQITYRIKKKKQLDIYFGAENAFNFMQHHPIVSAENPFSNYFDASLVWGPIYGRMLYGGIRFKIK